MANVRNGNTWYVDTSSASTDTSSFLSERNLKLIGFLFHCDLTTDEIIVYDKSPTSSAAGSFKFIAQHSNAKDVLQLRLADCPIVFPNGVWVTLTGTPQVTMIFTQAAT